MNNDKINYAIQIAIKRLETTMIGALARFETSFGHLWGHHKDFEEKLTEKEEYFDNVWQDLRNNILNHGNNQIRGLHTDLQKCLTDKPITKYEYKFNTKIKEDDQ
jgi:hypothetical protein